MFWEADNKYVRNAKLSYLKSLFIVPIHSDTKGHFLDQCLPTSVEY